MSKNILRTVVQDATAWKRDDVQNDTTWIYHLTPVELEEIDQALRQVQARGLSWGAFGKAQFPLPKLSAKLRRSPRSRCWPPRRAHRRAWRA